jgi:hypothetical protein
VTIYRVGDDGATAIGPDSRRVVHLVPGTVIVPGSDPPEPGTIGAETVEVIGKRVRHYSNKRLEPEEDK